MVQSSVTMFPVLVSLNNSDGALMPGMNGQVVMDIIRRDNVLAVPSDAIRNSRDAATVAPVLGVSPDSIKAALAAARQRLAARAGRHGVGDGAVAGAALTAPAGADSVRRARRRARLAVARLRPPGRGGGFSRQGGGARCGRRWSGRRAVAVAAGGGGGMIVFVKSGDKYSPRAVRVGVSDFDYTEIVSGVNQGEQVALLGRGGAAGAA